MNKFVNPFELPGNWYKANLHTHTTRSDGQLPPDERIAQYRDAGYHVLALTDHGVTCDVSGESSDRFLAVSGIEMHPQCPTLPGTRYHIVGLCVPHMFAPRDPNDANGSIADVRAVGGLCFLAHPYWCGMSLKDFADLQGLEAMEVYNSTCDHCGRGSSEHEWANALDAGMRLPCLGVDDVHQTTVGEEIFEAWTWLKMPRLDLESVLLAIRTGACYASCGPVIHDFKVAGDKASLTCSPVARIQFMSGPATGRRRRSEEGLTITTFEAPLKPGMSYVRGVVTDARGRQAWTNPIWLM